MQSEVTEDILNEIIRRVVQVAQPERIILFGSAARGEMGPDSDLDLLVVKSGVTDRHELALQINRKLSGLGLPRDVIVVTPEEVERYRDTVGPIIRPAVHEGKVIYHAPQDGRVPPKKENETSKPDPLLPAADPEHWLRRAESDLAAAKEHRPGSAVLFENRCFDAQQAAEKALKAILVRRQFPFPKTHEIKELLNLVAKSGINVPAELFEADRLSKYAVELRDPMTVQLTEAHYREAVELAEHVVRWAEKIVEHG